MLEDSEPRPARPRRAIGMADAATLVEMGVLEEQPQPPPEEPAEVAPEDE
ncbi:hypothetical protein [Streptomyces goshikiensis]